VSSPPSSLTFSSVVTSEKTWIQNGNSPEERASGADLQMRKVTTEGMIDEGQGET